MKLRHSSRAPAALPALLVLAACASGPRGGDVVPPEAGRFVDRPVQEAWSDAREAYRQLRLPVGSEDRETWTLVSGNLSLGSESHRYVTCTQDPERPRLPGAQPVARLITRLTSENGTTRVTVRLTAWIAEEDPEGGFQSRECTSRGALEEEFFRVMRRQPS